MRVDLTALLAGATREPADARMSGGGSLFAELLGALALGTAPGPPLAPAEPTPQTTLLDGEPGAAETPGQGESLEETEAAWLGAKAPGERGGLAAPIYAMRWPTTLEGRGPGSDPAAASPMLPVFQSVPLPDRGPVLRDLRPALEPVVMARGAAGDAAGDVGEAAARGFDTHATDGRALAAARGFAAPLEAPREGPVPHSAAHREAPPIDRALAAAVSESSQGGRPADARAAAVGHGATEVLTPDTVQPEEMSRVDRRAPERAVRSAADTAAATALAAHSEPRNTHRVPAETPVARAPRVGAERLPRLARIEPSNALGTDARDAPAQALRGQPEPSVFSTTPTPDPAVNDFHDTAPARPTPLPASEGLAPLATLEGRGTDARVDAPRGDTHAHTSSLQPLTQRVEWLASRGGGVARLRLDPPHLGEVELQVRAVGSEIRISMITEESGARVLLEAGREWLVEQFSARDLRISQFEVQDRSGAGGSGDAVANRDTGDGHHARNEGAGGREGGSPGATPETAPSTATATPAAGRRVDMRI